MSADIPRARELLSTVLRNYTIPPPARVTIQKAIALMTRASPVTRTKPKPVRITAQLRAAVKGFALKGYSHHRIAEITGLGNGGRVSEILNGKR